MANTLQIKRGSGTPGSLAAGELGVDVSAKKLYSSDGSSVFQIGSAGAPGVVSLTADGAITAGDTVSLTDEGKVKRTRTDGYGSVDANVDNYYTFQDLDHTSSFAVAYDSRRDLAVIGYKDPDNSSYYTTQVLRITAGGTEFSFGKPTVIHSANTQDSSMVYCEGEGRFLIVYQDNADSDKGKAQILDVVAFGKDDHDAATHEYRVVGQSDVNTSGDNNVAVGQSEADVIADQIVAQNIEDQQEQLQQQQQETGEYADESQLIAYMGYVQGFNGYTQVELPQALDWYKEQDIYANVSIPDNNSAFMGMYADSLNSVNALINMQPRL